MGKWTAASMNVFDLNRTTVQLANRWWYTAKRKWGSVEVGSWGSGEVGGGGGGEGEEGRGLHSSTFQLSVSAFCGIKSAFRGCLWDDHEVLGNTRGSLGCILRQKRLRLS